MSKIMRMTQMLAFLTVWQMFSMLPVSFAQDSVANAPIPRPQAVPAQTKDAPIVGTLKRALGDSHRLAKAAAAKGFGTANGTMPDSNAKDAEPPVTPVKADEAMFRP